MKARLKKIVMKFYNLYLFSKILSLSFDHLCNDISLQNELSVETLNEIFFA